MLVPDYSAAYSGLDAHERPVISFVELCGFLSEAGEHVSPARVYRALEDLIGSGAVLAIYGEHKVPRYALRRRMEFRRACREKGLVCPTCA